MRLMEITRRNFFGMLGVVPLAAPSAAVATPGIVAGARIGDTIRIKTPYRFAAEAQRAHIRSIMKLHEELWSLRTKKLQAWPRST
jgi:hypothetical protein